MPDATSTTTTELRALIEEASGLVDAMFDPEVQMMAYILSVLPDGKKAIMSCPIAGPSEERAFRILMPLKLGTWGHSRWVFFTEAWAASYDAGESPRAVYPKARPDRREIVTFAAQDAASGQRMVADREIVRNARGTGRLLPLAFRTHQIGFVIDDREQATQ